MPITTRTNNRILPANARAVDNAKAAIRAITPVQQRRYHNAFMVQGYEAAVYFRLSTGTPCSCQARRKSLATLLNEEGKMEEGTMNELLTGGLVFEVNRFGAQSKPSSDMSKAAPQGEPRTDQFYGGLHSENQSPFEIVGAPGDTTDPFIDVTDPQGVNGPNQPQELDDLVDTFDGELVDYQGSRCTCCFGTGYVGGFEVLGGFRKVLTPLSPECYKVVGTIEYNVYPNAFRATEVTFRVVLPKGFVNLDAFRLWNNVDRVNADYVTIDNLPFSNQLLAAFCDGRPHDIKIMFAEDTYFTHLEVQVAQSRDSALIEFPRLTQSGNISLQDLTDSVQINASPLIPKLGTQDVIVESTFGKTFIVSSSNWWNDRDRNVHGWDCQARVVQTSELLSLLPRRRKLMQLSTHLVRDNQDGVRRT